MNDAKPIYDPATHYQIVVRGQVDVDWLQSFCGSVETLSEEAGEREGITVLRLNTDQAGGVGLVRMLHGLGITILQFEVIPKER
jgi:hypothetical protein